MKITLVRHGATEGNLQKQYIGTTDQKLSDNCKLEQKPQLDVMQVFVSSKIRTQQTASILYPNAKQIVVGDFDEMDFGDFEGKNFSDLADNREYTDWVNSGCEAQCPNGESKSQFTKRVNNSFLQILENTQTEKALFFVVHGGTIMAVCEKFAYPHKSYFDWQLPCGAALTFNWNGEKLEVAQ